MANLVQIERHLKKLDVKYRLIDLGGEIFRVEDVIRVGVNPDEVVKTLVVRTKPRPSYSSSEVEPDSTSREVSNRVSIPRAKSRGSRQARTVDPASSKNVFYVALAVRGRDRVDFKKVRRLFGPKSELAKAGEVQEVVGVLVGAVCPILVGIPLYFDRKVLGLKNVNLGSGDLTKGLEMKLADLLKAVGKYEVNDLV